MESRYSADIDTDETVREAFEDESRIRIRIQPTVENRAWAGVSWRLDCESIEEATDLREAMRVFFALVRDVGAPEVINRMLGPYMPREETP